MPTLHSGDRLGAISGLWFSEVCRTKMGISVGKMIDSSQELRLPRIVGTVLRNISLYSMEPTMHG